ncbi:MAG: C10 family peptidase [Tannerella sp.]|jgi:hypothetical protein|nr:C10 family peptidase [Tannerella sp.]
METISFKIKLFKAFIFIFSACQSRQDGGELSIDNNIEKINKENFISKEYILDNAIGIFSEFNKLNLSSDAKTYADPLYDISRSIDDVYAVNDENNDLTAYYIVNFKEDGYIILSGDKRVPEVLAFSDDGTFLSDKELSSNKDMPIGLRYWSDDMKKAISILRTKNVNVFENKNASTYGDPIWKPTDLTLYSGAYTYTKWGQKNGYNASLPTCSCCPTERVPVGCGPIAVGQIMRYWKYPSKFNWNSIPYDYTTPTLTSFLAELYTTTNAYTYLDCSLTETTMSGLTNALRSYGYNCSLFYPFNVDIAAENLIDNKPFLLYGCANEGCHFWVCNGYGYNIGVRLVPNASAIITYYHYFSMSWGWYGDCDGWYYIGDEFLNNRYDFEISSLQMAYNIYPLN